MLIFYLLCTDHICCFFPHNFPHETNVANPKYAIIYQLNQWNYCFATFMMKLSWITSNQIYIENAIKCQHSKILWAIILHRLNYAKHACTLFSLSLSLYRYSVTLNRQIKFSYFIHHSSMRGQNNNNNKTRTEKPELSMGNRRASQVCIWNVRALSTVSWKFII